MEHLAPQFRIRCLHRNIDRCQFELDDPLNILILHVGQRHIITLQEGKAGIIILEIKSLSHPLWHLVDETKHTLVMAALVIAHQPIFKGQTQVLIIILDIHFPLFSIFLSDTTIIDSFSI